MPTSSSVASVASPFTEPASTERLHATARALDANGFITRVVDTALEARQVVLELIPPGSEVYSGASATLEALGLDVEFASGGYNSVRTRYLKLDRATQMAELRKLVSAPAFMLASVQAVTESGSLVIASASGSQLAGVVFGANTVILVIGAQKIVRNLEEAFLRIEDYCLPIEDRRALGIYGQHSGINKLLILNKEIHHGHIHVVLVREPLGV